MAERALIYHILTEAQWEGLKSQKEYRPPSLASEGIIHGSGSVEQLIWAANRFYKDDGGLRVLCVQTEKVTAPVRWEDIGGGRVFPHVYGALNLDAVAEVKALKRDAGGVVTGWA